MSACSKNQQVNLTNPERLISAFTGGLLFAYGFSHLRGLLTIGSLVVGCGLIQRALTGHCSVYQALEDAKSNAAESALETASQDSFPASDPPPGPGSVISRSVG